MFRSFDLFSRVLRGPDEPAGGGSPGGSSAPAAPAAPASPAAPAPAGSPPAPAPGAAPAAQPGAAAPALVPADPLATVPPDPAGYDAHVKAPEGVELDQEVFGQFKQFALENKMTPAQVNSLLQWRAQENAQLMEQHSTRVAEWAHQAETDPEIGGAKFEQNLASARRGLDAVGSPALKQIIGDSGYGNHPEFLRMFAKIGALVGEGQQQPGGAPAVGEKTAASVLYGG